jgi:polar amino acid transport system permease protein
VIDILKQYGLSLLIGQYPQGPLGGIALTLIMSSIALLVAFPVAVAIALARISHIVFIRRAAAVYVYSVRGIPVLLMIFWAYFVLPLVTGINTSPAMTVICALVAYEGAYLGEAIRAAIVSLPNGQHEAARSLGLNYWKTMRKVILPQALFNGLPSIVSQFILIVKNTSLAYIVGAHEATYAANGINAQLLTRPFEVYAILAAVYFAICYAVSHAGHIIERRIVLRRLGRVLPQGEPTSSTARASS